MKSSIVLLMLNYIFVDFLVYGNEFASNYQSNECISIPNRNDSQIEYQCEYKTGIHLIMHVSKNSIDVDCGNIPIGNFSVLPKLENSSFTHVQLRHCPFSSPNLNNFFECLNIDPANEVKFEYSNIQSLPAEFLRNTKQLTYLSLKYTNLSLIEREAFANNPFLNTLDLQDNRIILEPETFFGLNNLTILSLANNRITDIPNGLFKFLNKLSILELWGNKIKIIRNDTFNGLISLKRLDLSHNLINHIAYDSFSTLHNLINLTLASNNLSGLNGSFFSSNTILRKLRLDWNPIKDVSSSVLSELTSLEEIWLNNCHLKSLPDDFFRSCYNLTIIKLNNNELTTLSDKLFSTLNELVEMNLANNSLTRLPLAWSHNQHLKWLNLSYNCLSYMNFKHAIQIPSIISIRELEVLDLSHNNIQNMIQSMNVNLKALNLSYNALSEFNIDDYTLPSLGTEIDLRSNNISKVTFLRKYFNITHYDKNVKKNVVYLDDNPIQCNCETKDLFDYVNNPELQKGTRTTLIVEKLKCAGPRLWQNVAIKEMRNDLRCYMDKSSKSCPKRCECFLEPYKNRFTLNCANSDLTSYPIIHHNNEFKDKYNQTVLYLQDNKLSLGPNKNLLGYDNVTELILSRNSIESIQWLPPNLTVLHVDDNKIKQFNNDVIDKIKNTKLALAGNPWQCDCGILNFTHFLRLHLYQVVNPHIPIECAYSNNALVNLNDYDICQKNLPVYLIIIVLTVLTIATTLIAIYFRFITEIKIWLYARNMCLWWITEHEIDKDKIYDAFISFSNKDEDFITENLLPVLESGPNPYKLCLHYRNWIPGEFIAKQIVDSVQQSRRTIVVLSTNFLDSVWSKLEFRTAHMQAMSEGRTRVIVILYGDICENDVDDELKAYLKSNTYVKWGDRWFWDKLKYAMPHSNLNKLPKNRYKHANIMSTIDEKFNVNYVSSNITSPDREHYKEGKKGEFFGNQIISSDSGKLIRNND